MGYNECQPRYELFLLSGTIYTAYVKEVCVLVSFLLVVLQSEINEEQDDNGEEAGDESKFRPASKKVVLRVHEHLNCCK